jgi:hypothetical protein
VVRPTENILETIMGIYTQVVQQLYVACFGRPADVAGLAHWEAVVVANHGSTNTLIKAFTQSPEFLFNDASKSNSALVDQVYLNLFGRHADAGGMNYWSNLLDQHIMSRESAVIHIAAAAKGADGQAFSFKTQAAMAFTAALDSPMKIAAYQGAVANSCASAFLSEVFDRGSYDKMLAPGGKLAATVDMVTTHQFGDCLHGVAVGEPNPNGSGAGVAVGEPNPNGQGVAVGEPHPGGQGIAVGEPNPHGMAGFAVGEPHPGAQGFAVGEPNPGNLVGLVGMADPGLIGMMIGH